MKSSEQTFASLIAIEGNQWHYHIPRFQREYVWGKDNWAKLLEDIYEDDIGHYMGSIICVQDDEAVTPNSELIYEMVDGQQRLTTLSLLLCAIYDRLETLATETPTIQQNEDFIIKRSSIKKRLIKALDFTPNPSWGVFRSGELQYCLRVQPSTQEKNLQDYQFILKEIGVLPEAEQPAYCGNRRIYRAFSYFRQNIPNDLDELFNLLERVYALSFIHISESSQSKAYMLFETLNYRGVPLSAIDIIKNKMLATLETKHNFSIEAAYEKWLKLLEQLPDDVDQNRFLRQYYNAFKNIDQIRVESISRAQASNVIRIYEVLIKRDARFLLDDLLAKAELYNQFVEPEKVGDSELRDVLCDLSRIGAVPAYTFLLYLYSLPVDAFAAADVRTKTAKLLCQYHFRRNVTDFPRTRDLDAINMELIEQCERKRANQQKLTWDFIKQIMLSGKGRPASQESFRSALEDNLYYHNDYMARYALTKIDEISHSREYAPNLWQRNDRGVYVWTVEHVFPQGRNLPSEWIRMIADGDPVRAQEIQERYAHCLGNLTLSAYNSRLSNQPFERKQEKSETTVSGIKIQIGYKNGLALNRVPFVVAGKTTSLATSERWTVEHIQARNQVMVDMLVDIFRFEGENE